jgi:hypothetical protein
MWWRSAFLQFQMIEDNARVAFCSFDACDFDQLLMDALNRLYGARCPKIIGLYNILKESSRQRDSEGMESSFASFISMHSQQGKDVVDVSFSLCKILEFVPDNRTFRDLKTGHLYWAGLSMVGRWVNTLKYHKDWLFVRYACLEVREYPERPAILDGKPGDILFGGVRRWLRSKLSKCEISLNSFLQGLKKGMLPVDDETVLKAAKKHKQTLLTFNATPAHILEEVKRTALEVFGIVSLESLTSSLGQTLSSHSCVESNRGKGGSEGEFYRSIYRTTALSAMDRNSVEMYRGLTTNGLLTQLAGYSRSSRGVREIRIPMDLPFDYFLDRLYKTIGESEMPGRANVKFILEPLKVRTISCGPFDIYNTQKDLQKHLWGKLQNFPMFRFTGESASVAEMQRVVAGFDPRTHVCVSGDYSSATDNMHSDVSAAVVETIFKSHTLRKVAWRALGPHMISYYGPRWTCKPSLKTRVNELPTPFMNVNGQLMGGPTSFPVLCVVNAAVYRYCKEQYDGKKYHLKDLRSTINGDDIAYVDTLEFYEYWRSILPQVGFIPSVGKNFVSKAFININSTYFRVQDTGLPRPQMYVSEIVPYVNMGLVTGRKKGDTDLTEEENQTRVARILNARAIMVQCQEGLPNEIGLRAVEAWKDRNQDLYRDFFQLKDSLLSSEIGCFKHLDAIIADKVRKTCLKRWSSPLEKDCPDGHWTQGLWKFFSSYELQELSPSLYLNILQRSKNCRKKWPGCGIDPVDDESKRIANALNCRAPWSLIYDWERAVASGN